MSRDALDAALDQFQSISLEQLDRRASLLRRIDAKYAVSEEALTELLSRLAIDHQILEIDGRRAFAYESDYFDSPDLRCFRDHVEDRIPRFKARTRLYRDTGHCVFEVKLKIADGETDKRQVDHDPASVSRLDDAAEQCLAEALRDASIEPPQSALGLSLVTRFVRFTLAPSEKAERVTCDRRIVLERPQSGSAHLRHGLAVVETKSEDSQTPADQILQQMGIEPLSLSKYRTGIALLAPKAEDPDSPRYAERLFERT